MMSHYNYGAKYSNFVSRELSSSKYAQLSGVSPQNLNEKYPGLNGEKLRNRKVDILVTCESTRWLQL